MPTSLPDPNCTLKYLLADGINKHRPGCAGPSLPRITTHVRPLAPACSRASPYRPHHFTANASIPSLRCRTVAQQDCLLFYWMTSQPVRAIGSVGRAVPSECFVDPVAHPVCPSAILLILPSETSCCLRLTYSLSCMQRFLCPHQQPKAP